VKIRQIETIRLGSGVETRGNSAVDIALWNIFGKVANLPVYTALGGQMP